MNTVIVYVLLALQLIGILYMLFLNRSIKRGMGYMKDVEQRLAEQNRKLFKEVTLLKKQVLENGQLLSEVQERSMVMVQAVEPELPKAKPAAEHLYLSDRYKEIFELKEQGMTTEEIARTLQKGYGEVAFILDLAQKGEH